MENKRLKIPDRSKTPDSGGSSNNYIVATAFLSLFAIVGLVLYGLPF